VDGDGGQEELVNAPRARARTAPLPGLHAASGGVQAGGGLGDGVKGGFGVDGEGLNAPWRLLAMSSGQRRRVSPWSTLPAWSSVVMLLHGRKDIHMATTPHAHRERAGPHRDAFEKGEGAERWRGSGDIDRRRGGERRPPPRAGEILDRRRRIAALSLASIGALGAVAAYQT
jgi:hypothetical protein